MDRGAFQATVQGVTRVGHDLATKPYIYICVCVCVCVQIYDCHFINFDPIYQIDLGEKSQTLQVY